MDVEIAAVLTVSSKLELLDKLLERRIMRSALDLTTPCLPLLNKVYKLGEYRRLAANLSVMNHRIRCALSESDVQLICDAAARRFGLKLGGRKVKIALRAAYRTLESIGVNVAALQDYKNLPLYAAECKKLKRLAELNNYIDTADKEPPICCAEAFS